MDLFIDLSLCVVFLSAGRLQPISGPAPGDVSSPCSQTPKMKENSAPSPPGLSVDSVFNESCIQRIIDRYTRELNISLGAAGTAGAHPDYRPALPSSGSEHLDHEMIFCCSADLRQRRCGSGGVQLLGCSAGLCWVVRDEDGGGELSPWSGWPGGRRSSSQPLPGQNL